MYAYGKKSFRNNCLNGNNGMCLTRYSRWAKQRKRTVVAPNNNYVAQSVLDINAANHNLLDNPPPYSEHQQDTRTFMYQQDTRKPSNNWSKC